jgi:hypothetical protein
MANAFVSWLDHAASKVGTVIEDAALFTVKDILPVASKALEVAAPVVSLAFPIEGAMVAKIAGYIVSAQQKFPTPQSGERSWPTSRSSSKRNCFPWRSRRVWTARQPQRQSPSM